MGYNSGPVKNCYNTGSVNGSIEAGGVVGLNSGGNVENCYNIGEVSGRYVGGVVGLNSSGDSSASVTNCYNTGEVSGKTRVGGVVGQNNVSGIVTNCYFLKGTAEKGIGSGAGSATPLSAEEFESQESFSSWTDFTNTWKIEPIFGRPTLQANAEIGGTANNPYKIFTATQLENFRDIVNGANEQVKDSDAHAKLMNDIDLSSVCGESNSWTPIGTSSKPYTGTFNGNGHTISGLYIDSSTANYQGLFGYVYRGTVQDLTVSGDINGYKYVGGVVGYNSSGTVTNCAFSGTVTGNNYVGGVVGQNSSSGTVKNCYNTDSATVTGSGAGVGGVVGNNEASVENCYNTGTVTGTGDFVGGVVGQNFGGTVENCYNTGSVKGPDSVSSSYVGGVVGDNSSGSVKNCYNTGSVTVTGSIGRVGGVVGFNSGPVKNCYNTGTVSDGTTSGGVVGENFGSGSVTNCYFLPTADVNKNLSGIGFGGEGQEAIQKTADAFHSGEVAWLLENGQTDGSSQVWGQSNLTATTSLPTLVALDKDENAKPVYKVAFISDNEEHDAKYANIGMTVDLPATEPTKEGYTFSYWQDKAGTQVTEPITVTADTTFTAQWTPHTYSITASPSALDFGSITEGEERPAAQTVTITNTGNQAVTLNPPTAENFEITTSDNLTLNAGATASFTIQPKDNLPRGSYSEQIAISNTNGEKAAITATFTVKEPPYTGKYSYEVSTSVGDHGSLTVDRYATEGDTVTIQVAPDQAYKLDELVVTANGKDVELTANSDGTYSFTMPSADVKITATFAKDPDWTEPEEPTTDVSDLFVDIAPNAWYKDAVQYAYDNGLMTGVSANEFAPEQTTTRAMIVSILARLESVTTAQAAGFADVDDNDWYATAVNWAANVGVVNGYEDNTFQPNTAITREQLAAILMNYSAYKGEDVSNRADLANYTDQPSTWANEAMQWAVAEGLITGITNDELQPQGNATRAQVAAILQRFLDK